MNLRENLEELINEYKAVEGIPRRQSMKYVLADLMHLAKEKNINWQELLTDAQETFHYEVMQETN